MNFFPDFYQNKIYHISVNYQYDGWAPWNKNLYADSLKVRLVDYYKKQYPGNDFIILKDKLNNDVFFKADGNRRILIGSLDEQFVNVDITDLLIEEKLTKESKK
jgi:hypothetical protein